VISQGFEAAAMRDDGFYLNDLAAGAVVEVETQHHRYTLVKGPGAHVRISGHPTYCPEPVDVQIEGSVGGRPMQGHRPRHVLGLQAPRLR